ncbi:MULTISPECIES: hypothetical protein [Sutcliffiella]|uniref:Uncharacterized protein n=1 Tax=Sutcliffiella cohnii TaxID=33932 RepID=A0A223KLZ2_9BACI|nr:MULTISPECIES: hypothetical protein [Sutcliffiella]AST90387.1 hypothetical protein BC6307_03425 [Sutcliffiella cohnii]WBL16041.1 hypothetical protein O1A01_05245 [Sutcliffiella sp. NC1]
MKNNKVVTLFFSGYFLLLLSLILGVLFFQYERNEEETINLSFSEELEKYEKEVEVREMELSNSRKWTVSKEFALTAVTIGAILDVVLVVLWAKYENKKKKSPAAFNKKRWRDSKWFWYIFAFGVIQPKNHKLVINWANMVTLFFLMHLLFFFLFS